MVYVHVREGVEYLLIGDIAWSLDNVTELKLRPEATINRINEDPEALMAQLRWLNGTLQEGIIVVPSHDDELLNELVSDGLLGDSLALR